MNREKFYVYASAILAALTLTFNNLEILTWISIIPFIISVNKLKCSLREGYKFGFRYFMIFYIVVFSWILELYPLDWMGINNIVSFIIIGLAWVTLAVIEAAIMAFLVPIYMKVKSNHIVINVISFSFIWIIFEWIQSIGQFGMPWARLAISQSYNTYVIQSAAILGGLFISFLIVLVNGFLAEYLLGSKNKKYMYIAVSIFMINLVFGVISLKEEKVIADIDISLIQGNIASTEKWKNGTTSQQVQKYIDLTKEFIEEDNFKPEIIIWPETAVTTDLASNDVIYDKILELAKEYDTYMMIGAFSSEDVDDNEVTYNSIYTIDPMGELQKPYSKRHLVPFGEYVPFNKLISKISPDIANKLSNLTPGDDVYLQKTKYGDVGGIICFESIFPGIVRDTVNDAAELIVLVTNDSWFKDSSAVYQHHKQGILRAVENNRYVVRAANTGISSLIDNKGRVIEDIPLLEEGVINSSVAMISKKSIYSDVGDIIILLGFVWSLAIYILNKKK